METGHTIPTFIPQFQMPLSNMNIDRDKVFRLITSLDTNKANGCDGISAAMIKICHQSIVEPLCCIFERCLETGLYPTQWKKANFIPAHKRGVSRINVIIALYPTFQSLERYLKTCYLMLFMIISVKMI